MSSERRAGFISGVLAGAAAALAIVALVVELTDTDLSDATLVDQARAVIEANYFEEVTADELDDASVQGMVRELRQRYDDRFSHYFAPDDLEAFDSATSGEFTGVGLTVTEVPRGLRVASVFPDTPAARGGLEEGDVITAVDGKSIAGKPSQVSTTQIKGPEGTEVELRIDPAAGGKPRQATLERASVRIPAAKGRLARAGGSQVAYVRYATFSDGAHEELRSEIERLDRKGAEGLVLDLRGNGGGLLNEAVLSAGLFVEEGDVVTTESRTRGETVYDALGDALPQRPTVVLINQDTASAAEILAAALQSYDLATIAGTRSYGKGVFQEVIRLPVGGALDLTVGEYVTADGTSLAGAGLKPAVPAEDDPETPADEALQSALDALAAQVR